MKMAFQVGLIVVVEHLGAELPFEFNDSMFSRERRPVLGWMDYLVKAFVRVVQLSILVANWTVAWVPDRGGSIARGKKER
jgi:hypothetical protein